MAHPGATQRAVGVGFLVGGAAFLYLAARGHEEACAERVVRARYAATTSAPSSAIAVPASVPPGAVSAMAPPSKSASPNAMQTDDASSAEPHASDDSLAAGASRGSAASAAASGDARSEGGGSEAEAERLRFVSGDIVMPKEEITKLRAIAARLLRNEHVKIVVEGFPDGPGDDRAKLARRRASLVRQTLGEIGVATSRMTIATPDLESAPSWAGMVRVRTTPLLPENLR